MGKGKGVRKPGTARGNPQKKGPPLGLIAIISVVAVVVAGGAILLNAMQTPAAPPPVAGLITDRGTKGPADAKVTITEYSDFQ